MEKFDIKKPREFGTLINDAFQYVRHHFKTLGKSVLYFVVPLVAITLVLTYQYTSQINDIQNNGFIQSNVNLASYFSSLSATFILAILTSSALATVVLYHMKLVADEQIDNSTITITDVWKGVKSNFLIVLLLNITGGILSGIGMIFLIIPGIFIAIKLSLLTSVYIFEEKSFSESFSRSWNLVKGYWWQTFLLLIFIYILIFVIAWGITLPFNLLGYASGFIGLENPAATFRTINGIVRSLSNILYTIMYICIGLQYYNLIERKEGRALGEQIDQIAKEHG